MNLPTEKTKQKIALNEIVIFIYGLFKIGKTEWASKAPSPLFIKTEPGNPFLSLYEITVNSWDDFLEVCKLIKSGEHPYKTIVIDTVDRLYDMCRNHVLSPYNAEHESDMDWGKGWTVVKNELDRVLNKLALLPYGLILVSHTKEVEIKTRVGSHSKMVPNLPSGVKSYLLGNSSLILYFHTGETADKDGNIVDINLIGTKPNLYFEAGDYTGQLPALIPMDWEKFSEEYDVAVNAAMELGTLGRSYIEQQQILKDQKNQENLELKDTQPRRRTR